MCGIAGFSGSFDRDLLVAMNDRISHRGPDDADTLLIEHSASRVGLAHRRLSIIDLSANAHEPMGVRCEVCGIDSRANETRGRWLVYNGEIYNYRELRDQLLSAGHTFISKSDTEVLLHLYGDEGTAFLNRLNGMFAFALFDGRGHRTDARMPAGSVLIARDAFGVKPLYYAETPRGLLFASELKAILASSDVPRDLDYGALHQYISFLWAAAPATPFANVRKLPPGEACVINRGRIEQRWQYYEWPYGAEPLRQNVNEIAARVRNAFSTAVERQLVSDVPVGSFLSGGLDSSAIVAVAKQKLGDEKMPCYSMAFRGTAATESGAPVDLPYAQKVAAHVGVELRVVEADASCINRLDDMIWHLDEPQGDPAPINSMLIAEAARRDGIKVLLSGVGGDDLFSGYRRHMALRWEWTWQWLPRGVRKSVAAAFRTVAAGQSPYGSIRLNLVRRLVKTLSYIDRAGDDRLASYFLWAGDELSRPLYSRQFAAAVENEVTLTPLLRTLGRIPNERDALNRMLFIEAKHFLADHNLNYADKTTMASGVESRVPFLDPDLVALATAIPSHLKQTRTTGKAILKRAMEPLLPRDVIYRPKTGFGAPLRRWLKVELRDRVDEMLSEAALNRRGLFDAKAVRRIIDLDRASRVDAAYLIFALLCIESWCRLFLDAPVRPRREDSTHVRVLTATS